MSETHSRFIVSTASSDTALLTVAELRAAAGVTDASRDEALSALGLQAAAAIARACGLASDGVNPPTLLSETCTETWRLPGCVATLMLSRVPVSSITLVTVDGTALDAANYEADAASGRLVRLSSDLPVSWSGAKVTVVYQAGFATAPPDLKLAASKLVAMLDTEAGRDANLKREDIPGVMEREWWVSPASDPLISAEISELLAPYKRYWI